MNFDAEKKNTEIKYFAENEEQMCMGQKKKPSMCNSIKVNPFFLQNYRQTYGPSKLYTGCIAYW